MMDSRPYTPLLLFGSEADIWGCAPAIATAAASVPMATMATAPTPTTPAASPVAKVIVLLDTPKETVVFDEGTGLITVKHKQSEEIAEKDDTTTANAAAATDIATTTTTATTTATTTTDAAATTAMTATTTAATTTTDAAATTAPAPADIPDTPRDNAAGAGTNDSQVERESIFDMYRVRCLVAWSTKSLLKKIPTFAARYKRAQRLAYYQNYGQANHYPDAKNGNKLSMPLSHQLLIQNSHPRPYRKITRITSAALLQHVHSQGGKVVTSIGGIIDGEREINVICSRGHTATIQVRQLYSWCEICQCLDLLNANIPQISCANNVYSHNNHTFLFKCGEGHNFTASMRDCDIRCDCPTCCVIATVRRIHGLKVSVYNEYNHRQTPLRMYCHNCNMVFYASEIDALSPDSKNLNCDVAHQTSDNEIAMLHTALEIIFRYKFEDSAAAEAVYFTAMNRRLGICCISKGDKLAYKRYGIAMRWASKAGFRVLVIEKWKTFPALVENLVNALIVSKFCEFDSGQRELFIADIIEIQKSLVNQHRPLYSGYAGNARLTD